MDCNTLTRAQRKQIVDLIRLGCPPPEVAIDITTPERLVETFIERYYFRPDLFASEQLGITLDEWQFEVALDVVAGERMISIRACHNVGKSTVFAIIALLFLLTRWRCKIVMTAPSAGQLFDALFAEVKSLMKRLAPEIQEAFNAKSDRIEMVATPEDAFLTVRTSSKDRPEALQGVHSDFVLLIADEASGIPDEVFNAAGGSLAGENCTLMMAGNPTRLLGRFAASHLKRGFREGFKRYHISKHPYEGPDDGTLHFVSTRIADDYETSVIAEHGRDSDEYRIRVLGDFPSGDEDSYIAATDVTAAMNRDITYHKAEKKTWSLDPARYGRDGSALGKRIGRVILPLQRKHGLDTMAVAGWVKNEYDETPTDEKPSEIMIDVIGIGAGVFDRLNEQGLPVRAVNVAETPSFGKKWMRLRDELWYRTKHALKFIKLPEDDELLEDLTTPRYEYASDGRLKIESKEAMRKRGKASPDKGDAVCMLMLEEDFAMVSETSGNRGWSTALVRGLNATL